MDRSKSRFAAYVEGLVSAIGHADRARPLRDYCLGLIMPCDGGGQDEKIRKKNDLNVSQNSFLISASQKVYGGAARTANSPDFTPQTGRPGRVLGRSHIF